MLKGQQAETILSKTHDILVFFQTITRKSDFLIFTDILRQVNKYYIYRFNDRKILFSLIICRDFTLFKPANAWGSCNFAYLAPWFSSQGNFWKVVLRNSMVFVSNFSVKKRNHSLCTSPIIFFKQQSYCIQAWSEH